jgi:hypothetical protein
MCRETRITVGKVAYATSHDERDTKSDKVV